MRTNLAKGIGQMRLFSPNIGVKKQLFSLKIKRNRALSNNCPYWGNYPFLAGSSTFLRGG